MNWKIIEEETGIKKIRLVSDLPQFDEYLASCKLSDWNSLIEVAIEESRFGLGQYEEIIYSNWLDWHEIQTLHINIPEDSVMFRFTLDPLTKTLIKKKALEEALLTFSVKLLDLHKEDKSLPENWVSEMKAGINKLKQKTEGYAS